MNTTGSIINAGTSSSQQIEISEEEFKTVYFSLKRSKSSGYDDISANVVRSIYNEMLKAFVLCFPTFF